MSVQPAHHVSRRFRAPWMIFWVAFGLRVAVILIGHTYRVRGILDHFQFGWEMGRIARSLVLGQGYSNPFNGPSGPTAWTPPLYPLLMALSFKLFGIYTNAAALFLLVCNSVFSAAIAPAVYEIAARCFDARGIARRGSKLAEPVAMWSAWMWAVYPAALQYAIHWLWEMSLSTCLFTWTIVLALRLRGVGERMEGSPAWLPEGEVAAPGLGTWAAFGLLWGLLTLSNASLVLCLPAMMVWIGWPGSSKQRTGNSEQVKPKLAGAALASVIVALVLMPWVVRNERVLHAFVPTRSNLGIEMYCSMLVANDSFPWGTTLPLWPGDAEFQRFVQMGEAPYAKMRGAEAKAMVRARPGLFAHRVVDRFFFFWDGTPHALEGHAAREFFRNLSYAFLSLCGLLGLGLMLQRRVEGAGLFAVVFLLVPLPYYLITVQARFRHPLEPLIAVLGVYLFRSAAARGQEQATANAKGAKFAEVRKEV